MQSHPSPKCKAARACKVCVAVGLNVGGMPSPRLGLLHYLRVCIWRRLAQQVACRIMMMIVLHIAAGTLLGMAVPRFLHLAISIVSACRAGGTGGGAFLGDIL
jgi:hypothetical protein